MDHARKALVTAIISALTTLCLNPQTIDRLLKHEQKPLVCIVKTKR